MASLARTLSLALGLCWCLASPLASAEDDELAERRKAAQALADNAFDLLQKGLYDEAASLFRKADERFHSPVFMLFEAEAREKQGKLLAARALLDAVAREKLAEYAPDAFRTAQDKARARLKALDARIPTVTVSLPRVDAAAVTVTLGDRKLSGDEAQTPIRLELGSYEVTATGPDGRTDQASVTLGEGARETVELDVAPRAVGGDTDAGGAPWWLGAAIAYGVGGAGLVMGAVAGGVFVGKADDLKAKCEAYPTPGSDPNLCPPDTAEEGDDVKLIGNVATAGFVIAGVGAVAGTLLLLLVPHGDAEVSAAVFVSPTGLSVHGRF